MNQQVDCSVVSEIRTAGATFQVADYHWDAGTEILEREETILLRWRMRPYRIKTKAWLDPGQEASFGQLMLHPAGVATHAYAADEQEDVRCLDCHFDRDWIQDVTGTNFDRIDGPLTSSLDLRNADLDHSMRRLMREMVEPGFASVVLAESLGSSMAVDIVRQFGMQRRADEVLSDAKGGLSPGRLRQIRDYIISFQEGSPTLAGVAAQCGVSVAHLRRMYKSTTGHTLHQFIEELRVSRAKALLLDTNLPLKVISHKLGFCHPSAFSFAFKKTAGESPRAFRHRCATGVTSVD
ncbi:helix-turn-helix transcriptional regulator [Sphingomonas sp.]|uniref:helix-turn-helix transcriptional regulator n=1 Tax=Sphingomonas sp. TaxID=28214 RepID=UPI003AFF793A